MLPCIPRTKRPLIARWPSSASADTETIRGWWRRWPNANVGIAAGPESDLLVLDVDGDASLLLEGFELPATPMQVTGGGGNQFFFQFPGVLQAAPTTRTSVFPNVDTRGRGGFAIAPPSVHPSGRVYRWAEAMGPSDLPLAAVPTWLLDTLRPIRNRGSRLRATPLILSFAYVQAAIERECLNLAESREGSRNDTLNRATYALGRFIASGDADPVAVVRALTVAADAAGLPEREIARTLASALRARGISL